MTASGRTGWSRLVTITRPFFQSEARFKGLGLFALLLTILLTFNGLNVLNNFVGSYFMTAIEKRELSRFLYLALIYAGVFIASTVVAAFSSFFEESLALLWRNWLTKHLTDRYLANQAYYRIKLAGKLDNPDQRISEDVKTFTTNTLSIALILINSTIALCLFSGVLWSITFWLFLAVVGYAACGSLLIIVVGRKLVRLDVQQFKKEADLRYELIRVREHAESVALLGGEERENARVRGRLVSVVENCRRIIRINRNLRFFTSGFDYMTQLLPVLVVAPFYIRGDIQEFGVVTQSTMAFMTTLNAFSIIVKEFQRLTTFAAVVERLSAFDEALQGPPDDKAPMEMAEDPGRLAFEGLTLLTPDTGRLLIEGLSLEVPRGKRLLVVGPEGSGRTALLRAAAGHWKSGQGRITRPPLEGVLFLTQQPYLVPGSLRDQLLYSCRREVSDEQLQAVLADVGLEAVAGRVGGLDAERDWKNVLSLKEQQTLGFARLLLAAPAFAFLDEATSALDEEQARQLYGLLARSETSYVSVGTGCGLRAHHDVVLRLAGDGKWQVEEGPALANLEEAA